MIAEWKVFDFTLPAAFSFKESKKCFMKTSVWRSPCHIRLLVAASSLFMLEMPVREHFFAPLHIWIRLEFASKIIYTVAINGGEDIGVKFALASNLLPRKLVYSN